MVSTALPLTTENVVKYIRPIRVEWKHLGECLLIPSSKLEKIRTSVASNEERLVALVNTWLKGNGAQQTWRFLMFALDCMRATSVANGLKGFTEPPKGNDILCMCFDVPVVLTHALYRSYNDSCQPCVSDDFS